MFDHYIENGEKMDCVMGCKYLIIMDNCGHWNVDNCL